MGGWESSCPNRLHVGHWYGAQHGSSSKAVMILTGKRKRRRELATGRCRIFPKAFGRISCDGPRSAPPFLLPQVPSFPWPTGIKLEQVMVVGSTIFSPSAGSASYLHFATSKTGEHCDRCCAHGLGWVGLVITDLPPP